MPKLNTPDRESRIKRCYDLHKQGLSVRAIKAQLEKEGIIVSFPQVSFDIHAEKAREVILTGLIPFWCNDQTANYPYCCFNHRVGLPREIRKKEKTLDPVAKIYDYQLEIFDAIEKRLKAIQTKECKPQK